MKGFYGATTLARRNLSFLGVGQSKLSSTARDCAGAMAAQAVGKKYRMLNADKQVEKFCGTKAEKVSDKCAGALEAQQMGKGTYRMINTEKQIAKWCSVDAATTAAAAGQYTPASPQEVAEELYWDESQMPTADSGFSADVEDEKSSMLLPLALGVGAIMLLGGVFLASR